MCWGEGGSGRLGNGGWADSDIPVDVAVFRGDGSLADHDANLSSRASAIDAAIETLHTELNARSDTIDNTLAGVEVNLDNLALDLDDIDSDVLHLSDQFEDLAQDIVLLDGTVENLFADIDADIADLNTDIADLAVRLDSIEAGLVSCELQVSGLSRIGTGKDRNVEFFIHTTLNGARSFPSMLTVWIGQNELSPIDPLAGQMVAGVTRVELEGEAVSDTEVQPMTVEADLSGVTCSQVIALQPDR
jgi:hypothetical protein